MVHFERHCQNAPGAAVAAAGAAAGAAAATASILVTICAIAKLNAVAAAGRQQLEQLPKTDVLQSQCHLSLTLV